MSSNSDSKPKRKVTRKKSRIAKKASCIRRTMSVSGVKRSALIDSPRFTQASYIKEMSGKFSKLIETIRDIDAADMRRDGVKYKHLIFTDIRDSSYGAKALAGFLVTGGFQLRMGLQKKLVKRGAAMVETKKGETTLIETEPVPGGSNGFALLQSVPLWKNPMSVVVKKRILQVFNSRPDNIHGEQVRIIVLDSKYKEGIDLFDVRYVHLLEPPIATSDLKQAVGRATRYCGQKGLRFVPNKGWPLDVFIYNVEIPGRPPFIAEDGRAIQKTDAHSLMLANSGLDLAMLHLTEELTRLAITSAVDYDLTYNINNFSVEEAVEDAVEAVVEIGLQEGGGRKRIVAIHDVADITPELLLKCSQRKNKLFPYTRGQIVDTAKSMGIKIARGAKRARACDIIKENPDLLTKLLTLPAAKPRPRKIIASAEATGSFGSRLPTSPLGSVGSPRFPLVASTAATGSFGSRLPDSPLGSVRSPRFPSPATLRSTPYSAVARMFASPERSAMTLKSIAKLPFNEFQTAVAELYGSFGWESPIVKSGCDSVSAASYGKPVSFTKTQDFVRHYLTPGSPFKGLLAWHSVGTGKTCMAVAAASTAFEAAGYNILWVTRNALMADVYKNIFGSVCSAPLIQAIEDNGLVIPAEKSKAMRLLGRGWFAPITYRMLQNALKKENALGRSLYEANPEDPLKKTFLIIDEIHKLQDGDLSAAETADFEFIRSAIWKSYDASGADSVRPLLMTATPIADTPRELFEILNTLIPTESRRLMPLESFREKFTNDAGIVNEDGKEYFKEKAKGLISYLNREFDPTTFAQPRFHNIIVPLGETRVPSVEELVNACTANLTLEKPVAVDCSGLETELAEELAALDVLPKKEQRGAKAALKQDFKARIKTCKNSARAAGRALKNGLKTIVKDASACFRKTRKAYTATRAASQLVAAEKCFGKPTKSQFVVLSDFKEGIAAKYTKEEKADPRSVDAVHIMAETK
jgi:hypothetical protein